MASSSGSREFQFFRTRHPAERRLRVLRSKHLTMTQGTREKLIQAKRGIRTENGINVSTLPGQTRNHPPTLAKVPETNPERRSQTTISQQSAQSYAVTIITGLYLHRNNAITLDPPAGKWAPTLADFSQDLARTSLWSRVSRRVGQVIAMGMKSCTTRGGGQNSVTTSGHACFYADSPRPI